MTSDLSQPLTIHEIVQERYGALARTQESDATQITTCCDTGACCDASCASIDVIMSNCVINLSPDKAAVFQQAYRVLKAGGRIAVSDIVTEGDFSAELRAQTDKWAECVTGAIDVEVYTGYMREAGFIDIQIVDKQTADTLIPIQPGMLRMFSARITARKPQT